MKKKKLKKEIAELRGENQALRERIEKLENLSRITMMVGSVPDLSEEEKYRGIVRRYKEQKELNPTNLNQILQDPGM